MKRNVAQPQSQFELIELIVDEILERQSNGESPCKEEYLDRYPESAEEIEEVFPALALMKDAKPTSEGLQLELVAAGEALLTTSEQIGDYTIIRELGRGGMGVVYEALQRSLNRRVALKVLPLQTTSNGQSKSRFQREAQAAAQLQHANIVAVYDVGNDAEHFYYAMQLINGQGLDRVIDDLRKIRNVNPFGKRSPEITERVTQRMMAQALRRPNAVEQDNGKSTRPDQDAPTIQNTTASHSNNLTRSASLPGSHEFSKRVTFHRRIAEIGEQAANALAFAHSQGIIHRDIKPSNLMLDDEGNVWVVDFGLAKMDESEMTRTGDLLGTLRYMSPERFQGQCDARSDIYGLGLTLYELLALRPAFQAADHLSLIDQIKNIEVSPLRSFESGVPRDLETVVQKCIDKDPTCRYQTARELADDLRRYVNDEPILARRLSNRERTMRWIRSHKSLTVALTSIFTLLAAFALLASFSAHHFSDLAEQNMELALETEEKRSQAEEARQSEFQARELADKNRELAEEQRDLAHGIRYGMQIERAIATAMQAPSDQSVGQVIHDWRLSPMRNDTRGWVWHYLNSSFSNADLLLTRHETGLRDVDFDQSGEFVMSVGVKDSVKIWEIPSGHFVEMLQVAGPNMKAKWSPTRKYIAVSRFVENHTPDYVLINVVDTDSKQVFPFVVDTTRSEVDVNINYLEWLSDSELLFHQRDDSSTVIAVPSMKVIRKHTVSGLGAGIRELGWARELAWSTDHKYCAYTSANEVVIADDTGNIISRKELEGIVKLSWGGTGNRLWTCNRAGVIEVCDVIPDFKSVRRVKTEVKIKAAFSGYAYAAFSADCLKIAVPCDGGITQIFDTEEGRRLLQISSRGRSIPAWDPQGRWLAKVPRGWNGQVAVWDIDQALRDHRNLLTDRHWAPANDDPARLHMKTVWSRDGKRIAANTTKSIVIWDADTLCQIAQVKPDPRWAEKDPPVHFKDLQFSPNSKHLATTALEVEMFDAGTGERKWRNDVFRTADGHRAQQVLQVSSIAWSPSGDQLAVGGYRQQITILDSSTGKRVPDSPFVHEDERFVASLVAHLDWTEAGLFWASLNYKVGRWRPGQTPGVMSGVRTNLYIRCHMCASPDGKKLAFPVAESAIRVVDLEAPRNQNLLVGHETWIKQLCWSFDGKRLASCDANGVLKIWDPNNEVSVGSIHGVAGHAFDPTGPRLAISFLDGNLRILNATPSYERECPTEFLSVIEGHLKDDSDNESWLQRKAVALCRHAAWNSASRIYRRVGDMDSSLVAFTPGWWAVHQMHLTLANWSSLSGLPKPDIEHAFKWFAPIEPANGFIPFHHNALFLFNPIFSLHDQPVELAIDAGDAKSIWLNGNQIWKLDEGKDSETMRIFRKSYSFHTGWNMIVAERIGKEELTPRAGCAVRIVQPKLEHVDL